MPHDVQLNIMHSMHPTSKPHTKKSLAEYYILIAASFRLYSGLWYCAVLDVVHPNRSVDQSEVCFPKVMETIPFVYFALRLLCKAYTVAPYFIFYKRLTIYWFYQVQILLMLRGERLVSFGFQRHNAAAS
jgi:hypothetical protein